MTSRRQTVDSPEAVGWAIAAYVFLGLTPLFWRLLHGVSPFLLLAHRVVWSAAFLSPWAWRWSRSRRIAFRAQTVQAIALVALAASLMASNWYCYVLAVTQHRVLEASLAYFLSPLGNVVLGVIFLKERIDRAQGLALVLAAAAVAILGRAVGHLPALVLILAASNTLYGLVKRYILLPPPISVGLESCLLLPAMLFFLWHEPSPVHGARLWLLVLLTGPITAVPLVWLARAVPHIRFSLLGLLFYLTPAIQCVLAIFAFHEPFGAAQKTAFGLIGLALASSSGSLVTRLFGQGRDYAVGMKGMAGPR